MIAEHVDRVALDGAVPVIGSAMRASLLLASLCLGVLLPCSVTAQPAPSPNPPVAAPDPATLKAAREVVTQMQGDRTALLNAIAAPMVGMMQQIGIKQQDQAQGGSGIRNFGRTGGARSWKRADVNAARPYRRTGRAARVRGRTALSSRSAPQLRAENRVQWAWRGAHKLVNGRPSLGSPPRLRARSMCPATSDASAFANKTPDI